MAFRWFIAPHRGHLMERRLNSASASFLLHFVQRIVSTPILAC